MRIQYASSAMHNEDFLKLFPDSSKMPGQQAQKFHRLMMGGLAANGCRVDAVSAAPVTPQNYPHKVYPGGKRRDSNICYRYIPVLNLPVVKNLCQLLGGFFRVLFGGRKDTAVVCDVLHMTVSLGAALAARLTGKPCVGIVTDLPELMVTGSGGSSYGKMVGWILKLCTHFVLLTEQMNRVVYELSRGLPVNAGESWKHGLGNPEQTDAVLKYLSQWERIPPEKKTQIGRLLIETVKLSEGRITVVWRY